MYAATNAFIHLIVVIGFCYALFTESAGYRERDMTLQKFVGMASFFVLCLWGFLVGELHNLKNLFALFF